MKTKNTRRSIFGTLRETGASFLHDIFVNLRAAHVKGLGFQQIKSPEKNDKIAKIYASKPPSFDSDRYNVPKKCPTSSGAQFSRG